MWYSLVCMSCPTVCISILSYPPEGTVKQPVVLNLPHPPWLGLNKEHGDQKSLIRTCKPWVTEGLFPSNLKQHPNKKVKLKYWMGSLLPFFCKQLNGPVSRMDSTTGTETCGVLFFYVLGFLFFFFYTLQQPESPQESAFFSTTSVVSGSSPNTFFPKSFPSFWFCIGYVHVLTI